MLYFIRGHTSHEIKKYVKRFLVTAQPRTKFGDLGKPFQHLTLFLSFHCKCAILYLSLSLTICLPLYLLKEPILNLSILESKPISPFLLSDYSRLCIKLIVTFFLLVINQYPFLNFDEPCYSFHNIIVGVANLPLPFPTCELSASQTDIPIDFWVVKDMCLFYII